jgi:hypothetical protein
VNVTLTLSSFPNLTSLQAAAALLGGLEMNDLASGHAFTPRLKLIFRVHMMLPCIRANPVLHVDQPIFRHVPVVLHFDAEHLSPFFMREVICNSAARRRTLLGCYCH